MSREREFDARELLRRSRGPRFELGRVVATPGVLESITAEELAQSLFRHVTGDWGELDEEDRAANDQAMIDGSRLLSAYTAANGEKFWIITERDRSVTTFLLPNEY